MSANTAVVAAKLKKIREAYIKQLPVQLEGNRAAYKAFVQGDQGDAPLEELHRRIHTMKGACASFRLSLLNAVATTAEHLAKEALQTAPTVAGIRTCRSSLTGWSMKFPASIRCREWTCRSRN